MAAKWTVVEDMKGGHVNDRHVFCPDCWPEHKDIFKPSRNRTVREADESRIYGEACYGCEKEATK